MGRKPKDGTEKTSKGFMSLHDFLLVGRVDDESVIDEYKTGPQWIQLYETAKKQFKLYGPNPPIGAFVVAIRSGLGGPIGIVKKIIGIEYFGQKEFFQIGKDKDPSEEEPLYLVDKLIWWAYFAVIPESEKPKEPESIL